MTINYYNDYATEYFEQTINASVGNIRNTFLNYLPATASILDAGCGSGRDSKAFMEVGHHVVAFDASIKLCQLASKFIGVKVVHCSFTEFTSLNKFDGVWACASLLHVPRQDLKSTFIHLASLIKKDGYLYCSFKYGNEQILQEYRLFNNQTIGSLSKNLPSTLEIKEHWLSKDETTLNRKQKWLNVILRQTK
jgi:2-polyprenyl-3-methyl-5-hydroxy-6-metoxy-1,4-benzoquinol methylase